MSKKTIKYLIGGVIGCFALYQSVYFMPLSEKIAKGEVKTFDAQSFSRELWNNQMISIYEDSPSLNDLIEQLENDPEASFEKYSNALGIGNIGYFKIKGTGEVLVENENNIIVSVADRNVEIETEFIYGNAICDASGLIRINDFDKTSDINAISEAINTIVRKEVIPPLRNSIQSGQQITFTGAIQLNRAHLELEEIEVIPVSMKILP